MLREPRGYFQEDKRGQDYTSKFTYSCHYSGIEIHKLKPRVSRALLTTGYTWLYFVA